MSPIRILALAVILGALAPAVLAQEATPPPVEDGADYRLFGGPTGRTLPGGTGSVGVIELFFPYVAYGITDRLQVSGGTVIAPEIVGDIFWFEPKVGILSRPGLHVAVGAVAFFASRELDEGSIGAVHLTGTFGDERKALTVGAGFPFYADAEDTVWADEPVASLGGELWVGQSVKLISENYFVLSEPGEYGLVTGGARIVAGRLSADVGLGGLLGEDQGCCLPIVNFAWALGGDR